MRLHRAARRNNKVHPATFLYHTNEYSYEGSTGSKMSGRARSSKLTGTP